MIDKALTLIQPYATLVAKGNKRIETRPYKVNYRGTLWIHAAKTPPERFMRFNELSDLYKQQFGRAGIHNQDDINKLIRSAVIAKTKLIDCVYIDETFAESIKKNNIMEYCFGDYRIGRYAWILDNIEELDVPIQTRGYQGLWNLELS